MRGLRKVSKPRPGSRRFDGTRDEKALAATRAQRCLLSGKRCTVTRWRGTYPNVVQVEEEYMHQCSGPVQAHHPVTKARGGHDGDTVPLCWAAHTELHCIGQKAFCARWSVDLGKGA
jgi:hypothetical protein